MFKSVFGFPRGCSLESKSRGEWICKLKFSFAKEADLISSVFPYIIETEAQFCSGKYCENMQLWLLGHRELPILCQKFSCGFQEKRPNKRLTPLWSWLAPIWEMLDSPLWNKKLYLLFEQSADWKVLINKGSTNMIDYKDNILILSQLRNISSTTQFTCCLGKLRTRSKFCFLGDITKNHHLSCCVSGTLSGTRTSQKASPGLLISPSGRARVR